MMTIKEEEFDAFSGSKKDDAIAPAIKLLS
jgi:hypothetical protein